MSDEWGPTEDTAFERLADATRSNVPAPARLKSQVYSALMRQAAAAGPLRSLTATKQAGQELCVFEKAVQILPVGARFDSLNYCRACHARVLAEHLERAPVFWAGCPYAGFHHS